MAFRNLKTATDEAITLFANKEAIEEVIVEPLEVTVEKFNEGVEQLKAIAPTVNSVDGLVDEEAELRFIKAFRNLMRIRNQLVTFADFDYTQLAMTGQEFEDYKSKYSIFTTRFGPRRTRKRFRYSTTWISKSS